MSVAMFCRKNILPPKRVCLRLKELRQKKEISLEELAQKTKIDKKYLQALEECRFRDLPEAVIYQKNFVKKYVEALGIDPAPFLSQYEIEEKILKKKIHPHKVMKFNSLSNLPFFLRIGFVVIMVFILVGYLIMQVRNIIEPPQLTVYSPQDGYITTEAFVKVQGQTEKEVNVLVNGKEIGTSETGQFEEIIDLTPGVNTLTITGKKKHGKITEIINHVVYKVPETNI